MELDKNNILRGQLSYLISGFFYVLKSYHVNVFRAPEILTLETFSEDLPVSNILGENEKQQHP